VTCETGLVRAVLIGGTIDSEVVRVDLLVLTDGDGDLLVEVDVDGEELGDEVVGVGVGVGLDVMGVGVGVGVSVSHAALKMGSS
jgi:hypothetical protein